MDPGFARQNGDWRQHPLIKSIFAACESARCDGGTRRLEDWVGNSSGALSRGGRPTKASQPAEGEGGAAAADSAAARPRSRPRRPPPVPEDSPEEAAVRARLLKMDARCLRNMSYLTIGRWTVCNWLVDGSSR